MRILYLCKRHYMSHDVIQDKYARLYEHPYNLAALGHQVLGVCLSYRPCSTIFEKHPVENGNIEWIGFSSGNYRSNLLNYPLKLLAIARDFNPDIIIASSDCVIITIGSWLAKKCQAKYVADLYDDYETFGLAKLPLIKWFYRRALQNADLISCVSQNLARYISENYQTKNNIICLVSTVNEKLFKKYDKNLARIELKLPTDKFLIGTAGGLTVEKGIKPVFEACVSILNERQDVEVVFAGVEDPQLKVPNHPRIHFLGKIPHEKIALLFSSLNVGIVYLRDTQYGQLSFPQKAYEMLACGTALVAARVGDITTLVEENSLYESDDSSSLAKAIKHQLEAPKDSTVEIPTWKTTIQNLNDSLVKIIEQPYR